MCIGKRLYAKLENYQLIITYTILKKKGNCERSCGFRGVQDGFENCYRNEIDQCEEDTDPNRCPQPLRDCLPDSNRFDTSKG